MLVDICRETGFPVDLEDMKNFKQEFRRLYDKAESLAKKDMLRLQKRLATIERALTKKYPTITQVTMPETEEQWHDLIQKYGNIMVTKRTDNGQLILAILDLEQGKY